MLLFVRFALENGEGITLAAMPVGTLMLGRGRPNVRNFRPKAIDASGLSSATVSSEVIMLDCEKTRYHVLDKEAARLLSLCDGTRTVEMLAIELYQSAGAAELGAIEASLGTLAQSELIDDRDFPFDRRRLLQAVTAATAGGLILPVITSITPDPASAHFSRCGSIGPGQPCTTTGDGTGCDTCCCCSTTDGFSGTCMTYEECRDKYGYLGAMCR